MKPIKHALWVTVLLTACGGNPFTDDDTNSSGAPAGTTGTGNSANSAIDRREEKNANGNGYASTFTLNENDPATDADDTFTVDGLAFDGGNEYQRGSVVADLGPFKVYESDSTYADDLTGTSIDQFAHRVIYGVSDSGKTNFAVVRTGAYIPYGFGGFVYRRTGGVTMPLTGQASYTGEYAALRDFNGTSGLEYATGSMQIGIDFADFNDGAGVAGTVSGRAIFDMDGNEITSSVIDALNADLDPLTDTPLSELPILYFSVGPGVVKPSGEVAGNLTSGYTKGNTYESYETGKYYALVADNDSAAAGEIVGIIVVSGKDPRTDGVTFRETGGFILYRQ
jgi:hypothetical protein